jgi:D-arabinose 1-dehydrogenase-like Zn-dependent alcohol dehydrogenase
MIGGIREIREKLNFCAEHNIAPEIVDGKAVDWIQI